jgi:membrane protein implicated in regulation of membrane protease activity
MRTYRTLLVSGALAALASGAAMIVHGDWQAALAAFAGLSGVAVLLSLTRLLAIGEGPALPARSAPLG